MLLIDMKVWNSAGGERPRTGKLGAHWVERVGVKLAKRGRHSAAILATGGGPQM